MTFSLERCFLAGSVAWAAAIPAAALAAGPYRPFAARLTSAVVYVAGAVVCHQRPERSFELAGQALPVCARCTGIYEAAAVVAFGLWITARSGRVRFIAEPWWRAAWETRLVAIGAVLPTAATIAWEWTTGSMPSNVIRAVAGVPLGAAVAWIVMAAARRGTQVGVN